MSVFYACVYLQSQFPYAYYNLQHSVFSVIIFFVANMFIIIALLYADEIDHYFFSPVWLSVNLILICTYNTFITEKRYECDQ